MFDTSENVIPIENNQHVKKEFDSPFYTYFVTAMATFPENTHYELFVFHSMSTDARFL